MAANPYMKIKQTQIMTATPAELTLMLYDGAIKFSNQAILAIREGDAQKAHTLIIKVENIIKEFQITLDDKYPISKDLNVMYDFVYNTLVEANVKKSEEKMNDALYIIRELRDTWKQAMKISSTKEQTRVAL